MARVGLVLGGGGVTGAAFHFGTLFALRMATGWDPTAADLIVGTSSGAVVGSVLRGGRLTLDDLIGDAEGDEELAEILAHRIYRRTRPSGLLRWVRHGLVPGIRRPGVRLALGSPALWSTEGVVDWMRRQIGSLTDGWPERATVVVAYELESDRRVAFGTEGAPEATLGEAVAASSAVPMVFQPVTIGGRSYVDGGIASGTNADLVLGSPAPLDLVIVIAPMASTQRREGARFYEGVVDRLGAEALESELQTVRAAWPRTDVVVLSPTTEVLGETRPNPLDTSAAVPAFLTTLEAMQSELARPSVWRVLSSHLP